MSAPQNRAWAKGRSQSRVLLPAVMDRLPADELAPRQLMTLAPPYTEFSQSICRDPRMRPMPGSIVLGIGGASIIAALYELTVAAMEWPWVIPCLVANDGGDSLARLPMLIADLRDRLVIVKALPARGENRMTKILDAARRRPPPNAQVLARWISRRVGVSDLEPFLLAQFREALEGSPATTTASVATFCRHFARLGPYTPRHWRALARFCASATCTHVTSAGVRDRLSSRLLADHARKFLGMTPRELNARVGWEWVAEGALRVAGYII